MTVEGIDVSDYQGHVFWDQVAAAGKAFGFAKASEGTTFTAKTFPQNWLDLKRYGLLRGAYHFARPSVNTPEDEAAHFLSVLEAAGGVQAGDLVALDLEDTDVAEDWDGTGWALAWLQAVQAATGCVPLVYSGLWYLAPHLSDLTPLKPYPLWLAAYGDVRPLGAMLWQYSDKGSVPGISGDVDLDRFDGSLEGLRAFGKSDSAAGTLSTIRDVANGWGERLATGLTYQEQQQASRELLSVAQMAEGLRSQA